MDVFSIILPIIYTLFGLGLIWFIVELVITIRKVRGEALTVIKDIKPTLDNVENIVTDIQPAIKKIDPLMDRVTLTIDSVNLEMIRVDEILETVTNITTNVNKTTNAIGNVTSAPADIITSVTSKIRNKISPKYASENNASALTEGQNPIAGLADVTIDAASEAFKEQQDRKAARKAHQKRILDQLDQKNEDLANAANKLSGSIIGQADADAETYAPASQQYAQPDDGSSVSSEQVSQEAADAAQPVEQVEASEPAAETETPQPTDSTMEDQTYQPTDSTIDSAVDQTVEAFQQTEGVPETDDLQATQQMEPVEQFESVDSFQAVEEPESTEPFQAEDQWDEGAFGYQDEYVHAPSMGADIAAEDTMTADSALEADPQAAEPLDFSAYVGQATQEAEPTQEMQQTQEVQPNVEESAQAFATEADGSVYENAYDIFDFESLADVSEAVQPEPEQIANQLDEQRWGQLPEDQLAAQETEQPKNQGGYVQIREEIDPNGYQMDAFASQLPQEEFNALVAQEVLHDVFGEDLLNGDLTEEDFRTMQEIMNGTFFDDHPFDPAQAANLNAAQQPIAQESAGFVPLDQDGSPQVRRVSRGSQSGSVRASSANMSSVDVTAIDPGARDATTTFYISPNGDDSDSGGIPISDIKIG